MIRRVAAALRGQRGDYLAQTMIGSVVSMLVLGVVAAGIMGASTFQAQMAVRSNVTNEAATTDSAMRTDLTWASSLAVTDARKFKLTVPGTDKKCRISEWSVADVEGGTRILNTVYSYPSYDPKSNPVSCTGTASQPNEQVMISNAAPGSAFGYRNAGGRELTFTNGTVDAVDPGDVPAGSGATEGNWDSTEASTVTLDTTIGYATKVATPYRFAQAATSLNRSSGSAVAAERHFIQKGNMAAATVGPLAINYSSATQFTAGTASQQLGPTVTGGSGTRTYSVSGILPDNVTFDSATGKFTGPASWNPQVAKVDSNNDFSCVLLTGDAYCWGSNAYKKLGDGVTTATTRAAFDKTLPVANFADKTVTDVSAGYHHACAIANSRAYCWGAGANGRLGNGDTVDSAVPVLVDGGDMAGKNVTAISAGYNFTCAIADGDVYCWGYGGMGGMGNGTAAADNPDPVEVDSSGALAGRTVTKIGMGSRDFVCVIADGAPFCWGNNTSGQLGNGTTKTSTVPVAVDTAPLGGRVVTSIGAGQAHACAVAGGNVYCWGSYATGRLGLGDGLTVNRTKPQQVVNNLTGITATQISVGYYHSCILATTGDTYCWGGGGNGRLGTGSSTTMTSPTKATAVTAALGTTAQSISASESHTCILSSGAPYCFGMGASYRLGTGAASDVYTPAPALGLPGNAGFPATVQVTVTAGTTTASTTITLRIK
jgi:alpha-tubulin suppressor-like RCC1 family protein